MNRSKSFPSTWRRAFSRFRHGAAGISPTAVAVGFVMSEYADWTTGGNIRPGRKRLAETLGVDVATIGRCIQTLTRHGWIVTDQRGKFGSPSIYRLTIPPLIADGSTTVHPPSSAHGCATERSPREGSTGALVSLSSAHGCAGIPMSELMRTGAAA